MYVHQRQPQSVSRQRVKVYTSEEVRRLIRSIVDPKIQYFTRELQQKQRIIRQLNQRLNQNDIQLGQQTSQLQTLRSSFKQNRLSDHQLVTLINQLINQKITSHQSILIKHLHKIKDSTIERVQQNEKETRVQIIKLKKIIEDTVEGYKKRNNSYWTSIKQALNKTYNKVGKVEDKVQRQFKQTIEITHPQISIQLKKINTFIRKFGAFKKAVLGMQEGYKEIQQLSKITKKHYSCDQSTPLQYSKEQSAIKYIVEQPSTTHLLNSNYSPIKPLSEKTSSHHLQYQHSMSNGIGWTRKRAQQPSGISINSNNSHLHSSAWVNLSMQSRKEMSEDIRKRLVEIIQLKGIKIPIGCYLDQINYLKSPEGNYIFDMKGSMFKMDRETFDRVCEEGLVRREESQASRSRIKRE